MLTREQIEKFATDYLIHNEYPIITPGRVTMSDDEIDVKYKTYLEDRNAARVTFKSIYFDDPSYELDPGIYIVYVNIITGEVYMPPHM